MPVQIPSQNDGHSPGSPLAISLLHASSPLNLHRPDNGRASQTGYTTCPRHRYLIIDKRAPPGRFSCHDTIPEFNDFLSLSNCWPRVSERPGFAYFVIQVKRDGTHRHHPKEVLFVLYSRIAPSSAPIRTPEIGWDCSGSRPSTDRTPACGVCRRFRRRCGHFGIDGCLAYRARAQALIWPAAPTRTFQLIFSWSLSQASKAGLSLPKTPSFRLVCAQPSQVRNAHDGIRILTRVLGAPFCVRQPSVCKHDAVRRPAVFQSPYRAREVGRADSQGHLCRGTNGSDSVRSIQSSPSGPDASPFR